MNMQTASDYITICKPRVILLMLITFWVGMHLATTSTIPYVTTIVATIGFIAASASAAVVNHIIDRKIDARMKRTAARPIANGRITPQKAFCFAILLALISIITLVKYINALTAALTFATLFGYAVFYTVFLKHATPQNIVIGGAAGAMPPLLGWCAVTNQITAEAWLLVMIIYLWTPPHFWALALWRYDDYKKVNIPMLPVTHGINATKLGILLYAILLLLSTILPYLIGMSGLLYLLISIPLNLYFLALSIRLYNSSNTSISNHIASRIFSYSIVYLILLFTGLLLDHYLAKSLISNQVAI